MKCVLWELVRKRITKLMFLVNLLLFTVIWHCGKTLTYLCMLPAQCVHDNLRENQTINESVTNRAILWLGQLSSVTSRLLFKPKPCNNTQKINLGAYCTCLICSLLQCGRIKYNVEAFSCFLLLPVSLIDLWRQMVESSFLGLPGLRLWPQQLWYPMIVAFLLHSISSSSLRFAVKVPSWRIRLK